MLGAEGQSSEIALASLEFGRRRGFGRPIIEREAIAFQVADMATSIRAAELMVSEAAHERNARQSAPTDTARAGHFASEIGEQVCNSAMQIHGGLGYIN
jgi:butyryl-CoA dehydrogenase